MVDDNVGGKIESILPRRRGVADPSDPETLPEASDSARVRWGDPGLRVGTAASATETPAVKSDVGMSRGY